MLSASRMVKICPKKLNRTFLEQWPPRTINGPIVLDLGTMLQGGTAAGSIDRHQMERRMPGQRAPIGLEPWLAPGPGGPRTLSTLFAPPSLGFGGTAAAQVLRWSSGGQVASQSNPSGPPVLQFLGLGLSNQYLARSLSGTILSPTPAHCGGSSSESTALLPSPRVYCSISLPATRSGCPMPTWGINRATKPCDPGHPARRSELGALTTNPILKPCCHTTFEIQRQPPSLYAWFSFLLSIVQGPERFPHSPWMLRWTPSPAGPSIQLIERRVR